MQNPIELAIFHHYAHAKCFDSMFLVAFSCVTINGEQAALITNLTSCASIFSYDAPVARFDSFG